MSIVDHKITEQQIADYGLNSLPDLLTGTAGENKTAMQKLLVLIGIPAINAAIDELALVEAQADDWAVAEAARAAAELLRAAAEEARATAEQGRASAESSRVTAESGRASAETGRVNAESARVSAESARATNESSRQTAESGRATAESGRVSAETNRVSAESSRENAESGRAREENLRVAAESQRVNTFAEQVEQANASRMAAQISAEEAELSEINARQHAEDALRSENSIQVFVGENPPTDGSKLIQIIDVEEPESFQSATIEEVNTAAETRYPQPYETTTGHIATCTDANAGTCYPMIYGKSVQDGTPTPEAPVAVQSAQSPLSVEVSQTFSNAYIIQDAIRKGTIKNYVSVGDYFTIGRGGTDWLFQVAAFDYDVPVETQYTHSMRLLMYPCFASVPFDAPEAIYYAAAELAAGTYWFINNRTNKYYSFTTTQDIPVGGQAVPVFGASPDYAITQIKTYASQTITTALETVTATISDTAPTIGTQLTPVNDDNRARWGNNNWMQSAIRQWLNSAATTGWWTAKNIYDRPQSSPTVGFLNGIDADLLACIGKVRLRTGLNALDNAGTFGYSDNEELVFLPSRTEMGLGNSGTNIYETPVAADGTAKTDVLPLFKSNADRIKYLAGVARNWCMRSPYPSAGGAHNDYNVYTDGSLNYSGVLNGYGAVPACVIY